MCDRCGVRALSDDSAKAAKLQHVLWFIRNAADSEVLGRPQARIQRLRTSIELLKRAQALDPSNPKWPEELGHTSGLAAHRGAGGPGQKSSEMELEQLEKAYELSGESGRDSLLEDLAKAAFAADQIEKAHQYSQLMLQNMEAGWNYGNRVHHGHLGAGPHRLAGGQHQGGEIPPDCRWQDARLPPTQFIRPEHAARQSAPRDWRTSDRARVLRTLLEVLGEASWPSGRMGNSRGGGPNPRFSSESRLLIAAMGMMRTRREDFSPATAQGLTRLAQVVQNEIT